MKNKTISFITDFGLKDGYVGIVKAVINSINPDAKVIDLSHSVKAYDAKSAAWILSNSYKYFPQDAIHLVVVDPEVGSIQKRIVLSNGRTHFVGPDSGVFSYVIKDHATHLKAYQISNSELFLDEVSTSFHARDIFGPVAAHLSNGTSPEKVGPELSLEELNASYAIEPIIDGDKVTGEVVYIDKFGNLITNISNLAAPEAVSQKTTCSIKGHTLYEPLTTYSNKPIGELLFFRGSHGFIEIAANQKSAEHILDARPGDKVEISVST